MAAGGLLQGDGEHNSAGIPGKCTQVIQVLAVKDFQRNPIMFDGPLKSTFFMLAACVHSAARGLEQ